MKINNRKPQSARISQSMPYLGNDLNDRVVESRVIEGPTMLKTDIAHLSKQELEGVVIERCSSFGTVKEVRVCLGRSRPPANLALVVMDTREEAEKLAAAFGRCAIGNAVAIFLQQQPTGAVFTLIQRSAASPE